MRLQVQNLTKSVKAATFSQKYAGMTKSFPTGSRNYMNCTGLCVWNRVGNVGIVAHIEAVSSSGSYTAVFKQVCTMLLEKINQNCGDTGSFSVVIFGAAGTAGYSDSFETSLFETFGKDHRLNSLDIMDMRNGKARGLIGKATPLDDKGVYGAGVLVPSEETFYMDTRGANITDQSSSKVEIFRIQ